MYKNQIRHILEQWEKALTHIKIVFNRKKCKISLNRFSWCDSRTRTKWQQLTTTWNSSTKRIILEKFEATVQMASFVIIRKIYYTTVLRFHLHKFCTRYFYHIHHRRKYEVNQSTVLIKQVNKIACTPTIETQWFHVVVFDPVGTVSNLAQIPRRRKYSFQSSSRNCRQLMPLATFPHLNHRIWLQLSHTSSTQ